MGRRIVKPAILYGLGVLMIGLGVNPAIRAESICQVTDPTGTPLNVRSSPNGKVTSTLKNGREVKIIDISYDPKGRPWAKVMVDQRGKATVLGWVFREFLSCYER